MEQAEARYFKGSLAELNEQQKFLEILHHDNHNGFLIRIRKGKDRPKYASSNVVSMESYNTYYDTYITLNSFKGPNKAAGNLREITCIYLDLDKHTGSRSEIDTATARTQDILEEAFQRGELPRPTMVTATGRGLGIYYVLKRSIANSKTPKTDKMIRFWKHLSNDIAENYKKVLKEPGLLEVDEKVVGDVSRIVRLPLTWNQEAGRKCQLCQVNQQENGSVRYWNMGELQAYCKEQYERSMEVQKIRRQIKSNSLIRFALYKKPFLLQRMRKLEKLQQIRNEAAEQKCTRELMIFYYYNTVKQVMENGEELTKLYNQGFRKPLDEKEVLHAIKSVQSAEPENTGEKGYYKISDKTMIRNLELTAEEAEQTGFGYSKKVLDRAKEKKERRTRKQERNEKIIKLIKDHPEMTYEEVAGSVGVSLRTVKRVAADAGIMRYQKINVEAVEEEIIPEEYIKCQNLPASPLGGVFSVQESGVLDPEPTFSRYLDRLFSMFRSPVGRVASDFPDQSCLLLDSNGNLKVSPS